MAYPAAAVANELLNLAKKSGSALTPMQVQKLVYFAHGWNLALSDEPLINERVEAWDYGPVIRSLYRDLREFGSGAITKPILEPEWEGTQLYWTTPSIDDGPNLEENDFTHALMERVWNIYGSFKAFELSEMTHIAGSPWTDTRQRGEQIIPDDAIAKYFRQFVGIHSGQSEPQEA